MFVDDKYDFRKWINFNINFVNVFWFFSRVEFLWIKGSVINYIREKVRFNGI